MAKNLVIVESPSKIKTIKKFLGSNYEVLASVGHVRDLPKSTLGIDVENDYEPKYITIRGKGDVLAKLRKAVKKAENVYLATDPDREGEAIAWHLSQLLKLEDEKVKRITFNEITKNAVKASLKEARKIDMDLVDAQQTRRILDRMVGYRISPVLWAKVKRGLSAGRVQSVALRLVCDREEEINAFIAKEYWTLEAKLEAEDEDKPFVAKLYGDENGKLEIGTRAEMDEVLKGIEGKAFEVADVKNSERTRKAPLPFITSTLQQEAFKQLNFSTQKTMRIAQQLYEGIEIKGLGTIGLITYLRTDSIRVADEAVASASEYIRGIYGEQYLGVQADNSKKTGKKIQDAHEAIRPTDITLIPGKVKDLIGRDQYRLYQLIWKRFVASQMAPAVYTTSNVKLKAGKYIFTASGSKVKFNGFMSVYVEGDENEEENSFSSFEKDKKIRLMQLLDKQHFTQPPAHYTEGTLVKVLEERGIGRPSTFAATVTTILARRYVVKENKNLYVTELGEIVNNIMMQAFPVFVDADFTANLETLLDKVGEGELNWKTIVRNFYPDLDEAVKEAEKEIEEVEIQDEVSDEICEKCGCNMIIKYGPHGKFLACPNFPDCRNTKPYLEKVGVKCPKCADGEIVYRKTKSGRTYFGCTSAPECDFMSWQKPTGEKCPDCGSILLLKGNKLVCMENQCGYVRYKA